MSQYLSIKNRLKSLALPSHWSLAGSVMAFKAQQNWLLKQHFRSNKIAVHRQREGMKRENKCAKD
jgi:hypothetical protein